MEIDFAIWHLQSN